MKRSSLIAAMLLLASQLFAGKVISVSGKVDVMSGGAWQKARVGMNIDNNTRIMTGVNGQMKVSSAHGTFIVKELSMVTYKETSSDKGTKVDQNLDMKMGKVQVKFQKVDGVKATFKVKTPKGTASVRGTELVVIYYPTAGMDVQVLQHVVDVLNNFGEVVPTAEGQNMMITFEGDFRDKLNELREQFDLDPSEWSRDDQTSWRIINDILDDVFDYTRNNLSNEPERL